MNVQRLSVQSLIALIASVTLAFAATAPVGLATAQGTFRVNQAAIAGSATLFDGNSIETGSVPNEVQLAAGSRLRLAAGTRGVIYRDRLLLQEGQGQIQDLANYGVEAATLRIHGAGSAQVSMLGANRVQVAALSGAIRVSNSAGVLVAKLAPGSALEFSPDQVGAAAPSKVTGCVIEHEGKLKLTDDVSSVTFALKGKDLHKHLKSRTELTGVIDPSAKDTVLVVSAVKTLAKKCSDKQITDALAKAAAGAAAGTVAGTATAGTAGAAGTATAAGMSTGAIVAGVGVATAATVGAVAYAKANDDPVSPSQR